MGQNPMAGHGLIHGFHGLFPLATDKRCGPSALLQIRCTGGLRVGRASQEAGEVEGQWVRLGGDVQREDNLPE
jgi:hypothetical protein